MGRGKAIFTDFCPGLRKMQVHQELVAGQEFESVDILLKRIYKILKNKVKNKKICFLGVTFKANTDDMRDSPSLSMIPALSKKGAIIKYF